MNRSGEEDVQREAPMDSLRDEEAQQQPERRSEYCTPGSDSNSDAANSVESIRKDGDEQDHAVANQYVQMSIEDLIFTPPERLVVARKPRSQFLKLKSSPPQGR